MLWSLLQVLFSHIVHILDCLETARGNGKSPKLCLVQVDFPSFFHFYQVWYKSEIFPASLDYPIPSREPRGRAPWGHYLCILWVVHIRGEINMKTIQHVFSD